jgi:heme A synthase
LRVIGLLFRLTTAVVLLQLVVGGPLTFDFVSPGPHIVLGALVLVLALADMVSALFTKPSFKPLQRLSVGLVALILLQVVLGFLALGTGSHVAALLHFANALAVYGVAIAGAFMAMRWDVMARSVAAADDRSQG